MEQQRKSELLQEVRSLQKQLKDCRNPNKVKRIEVYVSLVQLELELDPVNQTQELTFTQPTMPAKPTTLTYKVKKEKKVVPLKDSHKTQPQTKVDQPEQKRGRGRPKKSETSTPTKPTLTKLPIILNGSKQYVEVGSEVKFKDVLGSVTFGKVLQLNPPHTCTLNDNTFFEYTVTIQSERGCFDRKLNEIILSK